MKAWLNDVNTTSLRIVVSIVLAATAILMILVAILLGGWEPSAMQLKVLTGIAAGVLTMMGFDVLQFVGKRFSDATYAAAKNPSQPVSVETPLPVPPAAATDGAPIPVPIPTVPDLSKLPAPEKGP
jgi:hypothetical protein